MTLKLNSIYKHYKGKYYKTLYLASDASKDCEQVVVYQALYNDEEFGNNAIWTRSLSEFQGLNDEHNPRFEFICSLAEE